MENNKLRKAAEIAIQEISNTADDELIIEHVFSERFEDQIRRAIIASTNEIKRKRRIRLLTLALSVAFLSLTFVYSPEVRAKTIRILKYFCGDDIVYVFDTSTGELTYKYEISELPEGYMVLSETFDGIIGTGLYGDDSSVIILSYQAISEQGKMEIYASENPGVVNIIDGVKYDYFEATNPGEQNTIVWTNPEETVLFTLSSDYDLENMIKIAKSVEISK